MKRRYVCGILLGILFLWSASTTQAKDYNIGVKIESPPFDYMTKKRTMTGIDIDILKEISKIEKFDYTIVPSEFATTMSGVQTGELDGAIAAITITENRKLSYDFSEPYYTTGIALAMNSNAKYTKYEDLENQQIVVKKGTVSETYALENRPLFKWKVKVVKSSADMYKEVQDPDNPTKALLDDACIIAYKINQGEKIKFLGAPCHKGEYAFAVKKGENQELLQIINRGIKKLKDNGKLDNIFEKYFGDVKIPPFEEEPEKTYTVAMNPMNAPFAFRDNSGRVTGLEMELLQGISKEENIGFDFRYVPTSEGRTLIKDDLVDLLVTSVQIRPGNKEIYDFSTPYYRSGVQVFTLKKSPYEKMEDLKGKLVGAENKTNALSTLEALKEKYGIKIKIYDQQDEMFEAVNEGTLAAGCNETPILKMYEETTGVYKNIGEESEQNDQAFAVKKGTHKELIEALDAGLQKMKSNGQYEKLINKYMVKYDFTASSGGEIKDSEDTNTSKERSSKKKETSKAWWIGIPVVLLIGAAVGFGVLKKKGGEQHEGK